VPQVIVMNKKAVFIIASFLLLFALAGCAPSGEAVKEEAPMPTADIDAGAEPELVRPVLVMPPPPPPRTDAEVWSEAAKRSEALKMMIEARITTVKPGPYPEPEKKPQKAVGGDATAEKPRKLKAEPSPTTVKSVRGELSSVTPSLIDVFAVAPDLSLIATYTDTTGLPAKLVTSIYVDETDAWIGTSGGGLARFNFSEQNWIVVGEAEGLVSNYVTDIVKFKGKLYVGTSRGLSIWDGFSWTSLEEQDRVNLMNVSFAINEQLLWIAARGMRGGLLTFDGEKWTNRSNIRAGVILNNVSAMAFDGKDIWFGTTSRGVFVKRGRNWDLFSVTEGIASNFIYTMSVDKGRCYLGGCCGLSYYDGKEWVIYDVPEGLPHSTVNDIVSDGGIIWLGSKNGLSAYNGEEFINYFAEDGLLTDNRVTALFIRGRELWVGTAGGLSRLEMSR